MVYRSGALRRPTGDRRHEYAGGETILGVKLRAAYEFRDAAVCFT